MNNLKYYNDSLAYDFEMFAPKTAGRSKSRDNIVVMPDRDAKKRTRSAAKIVSAPAMLIMTAVIVLAGLCGNIALRLKINEVKEDPTHTFIVLRSFLDQWLLVQEDYVIPSNSDSIFPQQ